MQSLWPAWKRWRDGNGQPLAFLVTWHLRGTHKMLGPAERDVVCEVLRRGHGERYRLKAFVVMDDHVHVIVSPAGVPLDRVVHSWKSFTAHQMQRLHGRKGPLWREGASHGPLRTAEELRQAAEQVVADPWARWPFLKRYPWVWEEVATD